MLRNDDVRNIGNRAAESRPDDTSEAGDKRRYYTTAAALLAAVSASNIAAAIAAERTPTLENPIALVVFSVTALALAWRSRKASKSSGEHKLIVSPEPGEI